MPETGKLESVPKADTRAFRKHVARSCPHVGLALKGKLSTAAHDCGFSKGLNGRWAPRPAEW